MLSYEQAKSYIESGSYDPILEKALEEFIRSNSIKVPSNPQTSDQIKSDNSVRSDYEISLDIQSHSNLSTLEDNIDSRPKFNVDKFKGGK